MLNRLTRWTALILLMAISASLVACGKQEVIERPTATPAAAFTGPAYLAGTVGSMTSRRGYGPILVSGFGLVVNLPNTGSADVPGYLRQEMISRLRKEGFGSRRAGLATMTPESVLSSTETAVVAVEGFIPPGAVEGSRFDVLVSALPQTGTTNLQGGFLRTVDLSLFGTNQQRSFSRTIAKARGAMYLHPLSNPADDQEVTDHNLQAIVIDGGVVTQPARVELILNQPSWTRSSQLAERINEVFRKDPADREPVAVAKTDLVIRINIPSRHSKNPGHFLDLLEHIYTQRGPTFEVDQARRLGEVITLAPQEAPSVTLAWQALGKRALEVIRGYYKHQNLTVRLAALGAGVRLGDQLAADPLLDLAEKADAQTRLQVAQILADLQNSLRGTRVLLTLLDDADSRVRIAAYEALQAQNSPAIQRMVFYWDKQPKFTLDLVPAEKPLIHVSTTDGPRIVLFNSMAGFKQPLLAKLWDNRLMVRSDANANTLTVFYQDHDQVEAQTHAIAPTVANLIFLLAHESTIEQPTPGFNLPFDRVVNVLYALTTTGDIPAPMEMNPSPLAVQIAQARKAQDATEGARPWTAEDGDAPEGQNPQPSTAPGERPLTTPR